MLWMLLAVGGQLINALVAVFDKYIVSDEKILPRPFVYAFYSCLVTGGWVVVFFFGLIPGVSELGIPSLENIRYPSLNVVALSFLSAYTFFIALVSMFDSLRRADASSIMPVIGAISALATFGLSYCFFNVTVSENYVWGVVLLSIGTLLVAQTLPKKDVIVQVFHSGLFFALHYITMKGLFLETNFDDGFFWSRIGFVLFTLSLLLVPSYLAKITEQTKVTSKRTGLMVLVAKLLAGIGSIMLLKATDLGDPAVVQALGGLQYVFILLMSTVFAGYLPKTALDHITKPTVFLRRMLYVAVILVGFVILFS